LVVKFIVEIKKMLAKHLLISGRVQRVGFRWNLARVANTRHVSGWTRNLSDGSVEVFLQGDENDVAAVVEWCHKGPPAAKVENVEIETVAPDATLTRFEVVA
jgi:acylphosphatase